MDAPDVAGVFGGIAEGMADELGGKLVDQRPGDKDRYAQIKGKDIQIS